MKYVMKYVIIDGVLQWETSLTKRQAKRAGQGKPLPGEPEDDHVAVDTTDRRSDFEVIQELEEIELCGKRRG